MVDWILRATVVLCGIALIPNSVDAQYGLRRTPHVLSLEDFDSDELVPVVRSVVPVAKDGGFRRNYRSHPTVGKPTVLTPAEQLPLSDDLIEHLESLLRMAQQRRKRMRSKAVASQTEGNPVATATPMPTTGESINRTTPVSAEVTPTPTTTPASSREIGKKWFPVLLQEAIDNVLRQNDTDDELDELVDHIAAGSGTYRFETRPGDRFDDDFQQLNEHLNSRRNELRRTEEASEGRSHPLSQWSNVQHQLGSGVPYVVNVFNNTHIGYIVMKVSNDSEIVVQESPDDEMDGPNKGTSGIDLGRRARKILPPVVEEHLVPRRKSSLAKGYQKLTTHATFSSNPRQHPYVYKTTAGVPGGPQTPEPPFFNILKTPDTEPIKYRVLLRNNNDIQPDKMNMRLPLHGKSKIQGRTNHGRGRPTVPKHPSMPILYSQGPGPALERKHNPLAAMVDVSSVEFAVDSRPAGGHGRVVRRFDYESLEEELPYEEAEFTYPDTVTEPTAKLLATGRHSPSKSNSIDERTRGTTWEPYAETRKYNLRRTVGPSGSKEPSERHTSPTPPTSPVTTPEPDSFEEDEPLHQATTNVFLKAKKDWKRGDGRSRKQLQSGDASENRSGPLKVTFDTRDDPLSSLFETDVGKGKRTFKKAGKKRLPWQSSEEMHDESRS